MAFVNPHDPFITYEMDLNGCITSTSPSGFQCFGVTNQAALIDQILVDHAHPSDQAEVARFIKEAAHGQEVEFQFTCLQTSRVLATTIRPQIGQGKRILKLIGMTYDCTSSLPPSTRPVLPEKYLQQFIDSVFPFIARVSPDGILIDSNVSPLNAAGLNREDVIGKPFINTYWIAHSPQVQAQLQNMLNRAAHGETVREELNVRMRADHFIIVDTHIAPLHDGAGTVVELVGSGIDITMQKRTHEALQRSKERYRTLADSIPILIWEADIDGQCSYVNQPWLDFTGQTLDQLLDDGWQNAIHPEDLKLTLQNCENARKQQEDTQLEFRLKRHDGVYRWFLDRGVPHYAPDRTYIGYIGSCVDITEQREARIKLESTYQQLRDLTARLEAAKEDERRRIAQDLHDEFGQTLSVLNMDLAWLQRRLEVLSDVQSVPTLMKKTQGMAASIHHAIHSMQQIATSLRPTLLDHLGFFAALEWQIDQFQQQTGVDCELVGDSEIPEIETTSDVATALYRITQELLTNIIRHAQASSVQIRFREESKLVCLEVEDNGIGILVDHTVGSSSLGLFGIRERVAVLNGEFTIQKSQKGGTIAVVRIPLEFHSPRTKQGFRETNSHR